MAWLKLTATVPGQQAESLSEALLELGALSVDIHDADAGTPNEQAIFGEPGEPDAYLWQHNQISALFPENTAVEPIILEAARTIGLHSPIDYSIATLEDNDWVRLTQAQFDPIQISQRLWIVPTWHTPSDPGAINIILDPGLAFGTGSHPTTRLCLRWLDAHIKGGENMLDYGCGSGILAIAALKLGASRAMGVDVDEQAIQASRDNAETNGTQAEFCLAGEAPKQQFDIVVANILTNTLKLLAPLLASATRPGGHIILSGILDKQADDVINMYAQWFDLNPAIMEDGWACLSGIKR